MNIPKAKQKIKELNDLLEQVEKLAIRVISLVGWVIILIKVLT